MSRNGSASDLAVANDPDAAGLLDHVEVLGARRLGHVQGLVEVPDLLQAARRRSPSPVAAALGRLGA